MEKKEKRNMRKPFTIGDPEGRVEENKEEMIRPFTVGILQDEEEIPFWEEYGYGIAEDLLPNFFDSPKEKEKKKRILSGLNSEQHQEL